MRGFRSASALTRWIRARLEEAIEFLLECLAGALAGQVRTRARRDRPLELEGTLARDLEHFVRQDDSLRLPLVPRRFEVGFGNDRAAPELQRGLDLGGFTVSGKMDRIDVDPFSARGIVQDYKSGAAHSARRIEQDGRLQMPLYMLALRDLVGIEPLGGLYRSLSGETGGARAFRLEARSDVPGFASLDYLDEDAFWGWSAGQGTGARARSTGSVAATSSHDPRSGRCPSWCDRWTICRIGAGVTPVAAPSRQSRAAGCDRRSRDRVRLCGRRDREDDCPRRAVRQGRCRAGPLGRLRARDHVHGAGGGRTRRSGSERGCGSSAGEISPARSTEPGSRRFTAFARGFFVPTRSRLGSIRGSGCSTRAKLACSEPKPSRTALSTFCRGREPERLQLLATYGRAG